MRRRRRRRPLRRAPHGRPAHRRAPSAALAGAGDAAARPVAWSSGRMSQALSTREIWCWGPPRQAWARTTTTGTSGRMRALVNSSCRARKSGLCRSAAHQRTGVVDDGRHHPAARWGSSSISPASIRNWRARSRDAAGSGPCSPSYSAINSRAAAQAGGVQGGGAGFLRGGLGQPCGHRLAFVGCGGLDRFLDLGRD